jgi:UDP-N-acetylmuramate dehydrogenase
MLSLPLGDPPAQWSEALCRLSAIPNLKVSENVPLSQLTRFELGGPAALLVDASTSDALIRAIEVIGDSALRWTLIGGGSNLVVDDAGFAGVVVRYVGSQIEIDGSQVHVEAGARVQDLVDLTIEHGLKGLETMTGIPGWVGGALYGNAGAYGHSIDERVERVRFFDGNSLVEIDNQACEFRYRESVFKQHKDWVLVSATLRLSPDQPDALKSSADKILEIRNQKYPPTLRCAGSIFKNLILSEIPFQVQAHIPQQVIREGKVPSAWLLEQAGAKGLQRGAIRVADYHANLIYNEGGGTSLDVRNLVDELKSRVEERFGLVLEEEVQYVGSVVKQSAP